MLTANIVNRKKRQRNNFLICHGPGLKQTAVDGATDELKSQIIVCSRTSKQQFEHLL